MEAKNQGGSEDPKGLAKTMLQEGADIEAIIAETNLSRPTILGLKGSLIKAQKKLAAAEDKTAKGSPPGNLEEDQINTDLNTDLKREAQITANAVVLARGQQRLKALDPAAYQSLHGGQQAEVGPAAKLIDLEIIRQLRDMRQAEEHRNNGGGAEATETLNLRKEIDALREEMHKKDVEVLQKQSDKLEGQITELREDMRHSTNSASDLSVVVREASGLLEKIVTSDGVLRRYLLPDNIPIKAPGDAPKLQGQIETRSGVIEELRSRGLVTRIVERRA